MKAAGKEEHRCLLRAGDAGLEEPAACQDLGLLGATFPGSLAREHEARSSLGNSFRDHLRSTA